MLKHLMSIHRYRCLLLRYWHHGCYWKQCSFCDVNLDYISNYQNTTAVDLVNKIEKIIFPDLDNLEDRNLEEHCRKSVKTNYHPSGTTKMGADNDKMAVLDSRMRVRGIENLRVCDLSAMPNINSGNTSAPAMMLGLRCADLILGS